MRITCLNPLDTIAKDSIGVKSYFLIESFGDTLSNFDIRSSCGCEYPLWKKDMKVYPGHPDTVVIVSSVKDHSGYWLKQSSIQTGKCTQIFYTGPWEIEK